MAILSTLKIIQQSGPMAHLYYITKWRAKKFLSSPGAYVPQVT